jgi:hypothetical protein
MAEMTKEEALAHMRERYPDDPRWQANPAEAKPKTPEDPEGNYSWEKGFGGVGGAAVGSALGMGVPKGGLSPAGLEEARVAATKARAGVPVASRAQQIAQQMFEAEKAQAAQFFNQPSFYEDFQARKAFEEGYGQPPRTAQQIAAQGKLNVAGGTSRSNVQGFNQTTGQMAEGVREAAPGIQKGAFSGTSQGEVPIHLTTNTANQIAAENALDIRNRAIAEKTLADLHAKSLITDEALEKARLDRAKKVAEMRALLPEGAERVGYAASHAPKIVGALSGAGTVISAIDALERYEKGDNSGAVLAALSSGLGAMASIPVTRDPRVLAAKGVGMIGGLGMIPVEMIHDYFKPKIMSILAKEGVYDPSVMDAQRPK